MKAHPNNAVFIKYLSRKIILVCNFLLDSDTEGNAGIYEDDDTSDRLCTPPSDGITNDTAGNCSGITSGAVGNCPGITSDASGSCPNIITDAVTTDIIEVENHLKLDLMLHVLNSDEEVIFKVAIFTPV